MKKILLTIFASFIIFSSLGFTYTFASYGTEHVKKDR